MRVSHLHNPAMSAEPTAELVQQLDADGFAFVAGENMRGLLETGTRLADWTAFASSWDGLGPDPYLETSGRHRRRRHAVFRIAVTGAPVREPHQPHYQSRDYNPLQGGIERWFEPVLPTSVGPTLMRIIEFGRDLFGRLAPATRNWRVEVHQFRIEARPDEAGEPTPEGVHRDGVDYVLVLMIDRTNIERGTTTIHAADGRELGEFTLAHPFDASLVVDTRVFHGVTPVIPKDPLRAAHRDVLVVTWRDAAKPGLIDSSR